MSDAPRPVSISHEDASLNHLSQLEQLLADLRDAERLRNEPARLRTLVFNGGATPPVLTHLDHIGDPSPSVGIVNPADIRLYLGLSGEKASAGNSAFVVPPGSAMVIPVSVDRVEVGADAGDLGANSATAFLLRFHSVQPFFAGRLS